MPPLLSFAEIIANNYISEDAGVVLTPANQSLAIAAITLLQDPGVWSDWDTVSDDIEALLGSTQDALLTTEIPPVNSQQGRVSFWHRWAQIEVGNALQIVVDPAQLFNHYVRQNTPASGDETSQVCWLSAGDYSMRVLYQRASGGGKVSWIFQHQETLDQVTPISLQDLSGTTAANQVISASFTLTGSGLYKMYTHVGAAGAVGAGFFCSLIVTEVWKTSD